YWHFYRGRSAHRHEGQTRPMDVAVALLALLLAASCQLGVGVAALLWLIPIGPWRRALVGALRTLTLTPRDSYLLLAQDIQPAALVDRVRRALAWLAERTREVAVVAHSQGAAIAHETLSRGLTGARGTFVSVGSGLEKLQFLRQTRETRAGLSTAGVLA